MTLSKNYRAQVFNEAGYVLFTPNVGDTDKLLQTLPPNPYAESATQLFPAGTKLMRGEEVWRYTKNGTVALNIAAPLQSAAQVHAEQSINIAVGAAAAIGDTVISLTSSTNLDDSPNNVVNDFAEGYVVVNDAAGEGQLRKIKSNAAFTADTAEVLFTLYDPLTIALTTASKLALVRNPFYKVVASKAVMTGIFAGVPEIPVTASYWFWSKTGGPAPVIQQAALTLGTRVVVGTTAAKADPAADVTTEVEIGYAMIPGDADTETAIVFLTGDR